MLLPHGASMGSGYGPIVVAREPLTLDELRELEIVDPGPADDRVPRAAARARRVRVRELPFDEILDEVASGRADAGLVIHEGQLTYAGAGLAKVLDLGEWWLLETGLPLPLGVNAARRDLGERLPDALRGARRGDPRRARRTARGDGVRAAVRPRHRRATADRFVGDVRQRAHDATTATRAAQAVAELLRRAEAIGAYDRPVRVDFVG